MVKKPTLKELRGIIQRELPNVGAKDHSRNIINTSLILIADLYGEDEAESIINELNLDDQEDWIDFLSKPEIKDIRKKYKGKPKFHIQVLEDFQEMNH